MLTLPDRDARNRLTVLTATPRPRPFLLGVTGAPGAGKSTFAETLDAPVLPMDGFHLANEHLDRLDLRRYKGAPATFDVAGFVSALARLHAGEDILVPRFDRTIDAAIAGSILLRAESPLIVTEGNYLLHDRDGWQAIRPLLDEVWYLDGDDTIRRQRLVHRHRQFGRTPAEATRWAADVDEPNAVLIRATRPRADVAISLF